MTKVKVMAIRSDPYQERARELAIAAGLACAGREWVVERVRQIVGGEVTDSVYNHHNVSAVVAAPAQRRYDRRQ